MTNSSKVDDRLDQPRPNMVGNAIEVENHAREAGPILLLPANQVPILLLGFLILRGFGRGGERLRPGTG